MSISLEHARKHLQAFRFGELFIEDLGWSHPSSNKRLTFTAAGQTFTAAQIAQLSGVVVLEITSPEGSIPDHKTRMALHREILKSHHENLLIFADSARSQSLWLWVKQQYGRTIPRVHTYMKGQPGDLFLSKLANLVFDFQDFDEKGDVPVLEVADRIREALDIERATKKFYPEYQQQHLAFLELVQGIKDEKDRRWYVSVLLNRLMFIWFLQKKFFLDNGDEKYLVTKLDLSRAKFGKDRYYEKILTPLFFEAFAKPELERSADAKELLGKIKYLNGGLFLPHQVELKYDGKIKIPDIAFENLFALFSRYSWCLNDTPGGKDDEISPDVLGFIFEKYINQKAFGAYYTRPEITEYLCERTIHKLILAAVNTHPEALKHKIPGVKIRQYETLADMLLDLDSHLCRRLIDEKNGILPSLKLLDPACGSGAFLVAAMKTLIDIYSAVIGRIKFLNGDADLHRIIADIEKKHPSLNYYIKKTIITNNLFGVDIMEEATEIAKLRLFLALVSAANKADELEPLPNIDFNILAGNSLVGLMRVDDKDFENRSADLFRKSYRELLTEKNRLITLYRKADSKTAEYLTELREKINATKAEATATLNEILLDEFRHLGIQYEQATWDDKKGEEGKPKKRALTLADMEALKPFHWGYDFDEILNEKGGFDAITTNPPWEVFQTNEKEFFQEYAPTIQRKKLRIEDWEKQRETLMREPEIRAEWLTYASHFPHQLGLFKKSQQYANQITIIDGKAVGNKPNLCNLFTEQCFNLLHQGGDCGIVIPSGIYTDLGTKQLRELLFSKTSVSGLFCFENRQNIFEGVNSRFKFVVLTFEKGGQTTSFPAAFMRHDVADLESFPQNGAIEISVALIRRLSPDSLSIIEFKTEQDVKIAEKMSVHPMLYGDPKGWNIELYGEELNMTRSAKSFVPQQTQSTLYEGGMIWQFEHRYSEPRYWVKESDLRDTFLGKRLKRTEGMQSLPNDLRNDYEVDRIAIRKIASNTNERTLIAALIPPYSFAGNSLSVHFPFHHSKDKYNTLRVTGSETLAIIALLNSFTVDYVLRARMTTNLNLFYLYQLPVPRLTAKDAPFKPIVERAARLICTTSEFDDLAKEVFGKKATSATIGATDQTERNRLRAELDGIIAHLYGLTEAEFAYILTTFPIVPDPIKTAAHNAYRDVARGVVK